MVKWSTKNCLYYLYTEQLLGELPNRDNHTKFGLEASIFEDTAVPHICMPARTDSLVWPLKHDISGNLLYNTHIALQIRSVRHGMQPVNLCMYNTDIYLLFPA